MEDLLELAIRRQAIKLLKRDATNAVKEKRYRERFEVRTGTSAVKKGHKEPAHWQIAPHFDPRHCIRHSNYLAKVIWKKILSEEYKPEPAVHYEIKKESGGIRDIMVFAIPDAAVATLFHKRITQRNLNSLSANSFSYRPDRNIFDAVLQVRSAIADRKVYVVQYDFSKYFDSINHDYLEQIVHNRSAFIITSAERALVAQFLRHRFAKRDDYQVGKFQTRNVGVRKDAHFL